MKHKIRIKPVVAWYDFWVGLYWDRKRKRLYCMIPFFGFYIEFNDKFDIDEWEK